MFPPRASDTCPLDHSPMAIAYLDAQRAATRLLDLQATIDRLPSAQAHALAIAAQAALTALAASLPGGTLAVGDHYLDQHGTGHAGD